MITRNVFGEFGNVVFKAEDRACKKERLSNVHQDTISDIMERDGLKECKCNATYDK